MFLRLSELKLHVNFTLSVSVSHCITALRLIIHIILKIAHSLPTVAAS